MEIQSSDDICQNLNLNIVVWSLIELYYKEQVLGVGQFEDWIKNFEPGFKFWKLDFMPQQSTAMPIAQMRKM